MRATWGNLRKKKLVCRNGWKRMRKSATQTQGNTETKLTWLPSMQSAAGNALEWLGHCRQITFGNRILVLSACQCAWRAPFNGARSARHSVCGGGSQEPLEHTFCFERTAFSNPKSVFLQTVFSHNPTWQKKLFGKPLEKLLERYQKWFAL